MLTAKDLEALIGQKLSDAKSQKVLAKIPTQGVKKKDDFDYRHTYKESGLELIENDAGRVACIFLFSKQRPFAQYGGELPYRLTWAMSQGEVRAKLGEPDQENGDDEDQWHRGRFRFGVTFAKGKPSAFYYSAM